MKRYVYQIVFITSSCSALKELPALEMGSDAASGGYPMLERLHLRSLDRLESIVRDEGTVRIND